MKTNTSENNNENWTFEYETNHIAEGQEIAEENLEPELQ